MEFVILVKPIGILTRVLMSISFGTKIPTFLNTLVLIKGVRISAIFLVLRLSIMPAHILTLKLRRCNCVIGTDGCTISVLSYAQEEYVIVDTHKHSENGSLIGVSNDIVSLLQWYKKIAQKHFNTTIRMCSLTWLTFKFEWHNCFNPNCRTITQYKCIWRWLVNC